MEVTKLNFNGAALVKSPIFGDDRGSYSPVFIAKEFKKLGFKSAKQISRSVSQKGILRGLHFQTGNTSQAKIVEVIQGEVIDFIVDLNNDSPTFGKIGAFHLKPNGKMLYVPRGFGHGFLSLSDNTIFQYVVDNDYSPSTESGVNFFSPKFKPLEFNDDSGINDKSILTYNINSDYYKMLYGIEDISMNERDSKFKKFNPKSIYFN